MVALTTYGIPVPFTTYDLFLGSSNITTLVRDLAAVSAFWFFREALARRAGSVGRFGSRWGLAVISAVCVVSFLLIQNKGTTDVAFITNRLDQTFVWIYGSAYMASLIWISLSAILLAAKNWRGVQMTFIIGFTSVIIGCVLEIGYLTASHFGYGGQSFRYLAWNTSELPFFLGLLIIMAGVAWIAIVTPSRRRILVSKLHHIAQQNELSQHGPENLGVVRRLFSEKKMLARASELVRLLDKAQRHGNFHPSSRETYIIGQVKQFLTPDPEFSPMVLGKAA
ncbi:hypothetical protein B7R23_16610 [Subtercola boreus]|nr:hypothetical protein B7R23_16610 [Subtercola boreus]